MKCMKRYGLIGFLIIFIVSGINCDFDAKAVDTEPDLVGVIVMAQPISQEGIKGQILIDETAGNYINKYVVTINDDTLIFEQFRDELYQVDFDMLEDMQEVQIWFCGPIMESFPIQGTAQQVVINEYEEPSHLQLAEYWAPVWFQDTDDDDFRADFITNFNFDGDWDPLNNWDNLPHFKLEAHVYYWVTETTTHWFIGYAVFHPRDWSDDISALIDQHENDMEGCLLVVQKDGGYYGQFILMITRAHEELYSYKDYDSHLSNEIRDGHEDIDGDVNFEGSHPYVYIKAEGHAVYGDLRWELSGFPGNDGVVYIYTGQACEPENGNDRNVDYDLIDIDELWEKRHDTDIFYEFGTFRGDDYGMNKANAPWGWDDKDDGEVGADHLFIDPAYLVEYYHEGLNNFSHDYVVQFRN